MYASAVSLKRLHRRTTDSIAPTKQFNLLKWFSIVNFLLISVMAFGLGSVATRFLVNESLERDALMSAQFIQTIAKGELRDHGLTGLHLANSTALAENGVLSDEISKHRQRVTSEFLDYLYNLPDSLLINIYSPLRTVIWSTNPQLVGKKISNDELEEAFRAKGRVSTKYNEVDNDRMEQKFFRSPKIFFIESYIPLVDEQENIVAVVEVYREPLDLIARLNHGHWIIWLSTMAGLLLYFGVYRIARRAAIVLASQEDTVVANKTYVGLGEISTAVAHCMRNPLACIRSSAEIAIETDGQLATKHLNDIVNQVDRMSRWVNELLLCLSPIRGEAELVEPMAMVQASIKSFTAQLNQSKIQLEFRNEVTPPVISNSLLLTQILNNIIANAIEAMPTGGKLIIQATMDESRQCLKLTIQDTGVGTTRQNEMSAFKSVYTTRHGRLGIGLIMVKQIMETFGGETTFTNHEQRGTSVTLSFKVVDRRLGA